VVMLSKIRICSVLISRRLVTCCTPKSTIAYRY
jgi:hypothetical protein